MSEISPNVEINDSLKEKQGSDEFIDPNKRIDTSRTMSPSGNEEVNPNARCFEVGQKESSDDSFVDPNKRIDVTRTIGHSEDIEVNPNDRYEGREDERIHKPPVLYQTERISEVSSNPNNQNENVDNKANSDNKEAESEKNEPIQNKQDGLRREKEVEEELKEKYPEEEGYEILSEVYLRDENGKIVKDPVTGEARRIDFVVVKDGKVVDSIEVTSKTADKTDQTAKENRIRENGGNYIKDSNGNLIEIPSSVQTRIERRN